jgi:hypothetical protein
MWLSPTDGCCGQRHGERTVLGPARRGGNLVTSFKYQLHAVGPTVLGGMVVYPLTKAKDVLRFYREFSKAAPDELTTYAAFLDPPGGGTVAAVICCYCGPMDKGEGSCAPSNPSARHSKTCWALCRTQRSNA